jgi:hypothetical protein
MGKMMQCVTQIVAVLRQKRFKVTFSELKANMQFTLHRRLPFIVISIAYATVTVIPLLNKTTFCLKSIKTKKENQSGEETSPL